jgi:hypothetical protein
MKDTVFFKQAELLLRILPLIHKEEAFALKGGTAIIHKRFRSNLTPSCQLFSSGHHHRSQDGLFATRNVKHFLNLHSLLLFPMSSDSFS